MTDEYPGRLYLATPKRFDPEAFAPVLNAVLQEVSVACVRVDLGEAPEEDWTRAINHLIEPCHAVEVAVVVADHTALVDRLGLDGVHLSSAKTTVRQARDLLGKDRIVGAAAGASRHQAMVLAESGADYVTLGPVNDTGVLGEDERADDELFTWWAEMIETPCVADGGVTLDDAVRLNAITDFVTPDVRLWDDPETVVQKLKAFADALA